MRKLQGAITKLSTGKAIAYWDYDDIKNLRLMLDRLEKNALYKDDINYSSLPVHPNYLTDVDEKAIYPIWACDKNGNCLVGDNATFFEHIDNI